MFEQHNSTTQKICPFCLNKIKVRERRCLSCFKLAPASKEKDSKEVEPPKVGKVCTKCGSATFPVCPKCQRPLPKDFEKYDWNLRISVVGTTDVGKSTFTTRLVEALLYSSVQIPLHLNNIHSETFKKFKNEYNEFVTTDRIASTLANVVQEDVNPQLWELCFKRNNRTVHGLIALLDTPGEMLQSPEKNHNSVRKFLHSSNAVFYLVDADALDVSTFNGFTELIGQLRSLDQNSGNLKHQVAVILSKYDKFKHSDELGARIKERSTFNAEGYDDQDGKEVDADLRDWLESKGKLRVFSPLLNAFKPQNVRFFAVSSCGSSKDSKESEHRILDPLLWALSRIKFIPQKKKLTNSSNKR